MVENVYGIASEDYSWIAPEFVSEWRAEAAASGWDSQEIDAFDHKFMFLNDCGVEEVNDMWFKAVQVSSCRGPHRSSFADAASGLHRTRRFGIVAASGFFEVLCFSIFGRLMQLVIVSAWSLAKFKPTADAPPRTILLWYNHTRLSNICDFNSFIRLWQVGWHGAKGRRGGALGLLVKDPMDGHQVRSCCDCTLHHFVCVDAAHADSSSDAANQSRGSPTPADRAVQHCNQGLVRDNFARRQQMSKMFLSPAQTGTARWNAPY